MNRPETLKIGPDRLKTKKTGASAIGLAGFYFSRHIEGKYRISRRPGRIFPLIFLRHFENGLIKRIINTNSIMLNNISISSRFGLNMRINKELDLLQNQYLRFKNYYISSAYEHKERDVKTGTSFIYDQSYMSERRFFGEMREKEFHERSGRSILMRDTERTAPVYVYSGTRGADVSKDIALSERTSFFPGPANVQKSESPEIPGRFYALPLKEGPSKNSMEKTEFVKRISDREHMNFVEKTTSKYLRYSGSNNALNITLNRNMVNTAVLKKETRSFTDMHYDQSRQVNTYNDVTFRRSGSSFETMVNRPADLVFRKAAAKPDTVRSGDQEKERIVRTAPKIAEDSVPGYVIRKRQANEVNTVAEKVYAMLEKRIAIERDRRGLS